MMMKAYMKVYKSIKSADYIHLKNGSVMNLINNFNNIVFQFIHNEKYDPLFYFRKTEFSN